MTSALIPFIMCMFLGRTIDLRTYSTSGSIYDDIEYVEKPIYKTQSTYTVLQSNAYPYTFMGLPVDLVLRLKTYFVGPSSGVLGLEGLLKDTVWKANSAMVAVITARETVHRSLKTDAQLLQNWQQKIPDNMTHYVSGLHYGGWSVTIFRFKCKLQGDVQPVQDTLTSILGPHGDFTNETVDLLHQAMEAIHENTEIRGKVTIQTRTYSSHPSKYVIDLPINLINYVSDFPNVVDQQGKPLYMELLPLRALDDKYANVEESHELDAKLEELDELYDDVKNTEILLTKWLSETFKILSTEEEEKMVKLFAHLKMCIRAFHKIAAKASLYQEMDEKAVESALQLYIKGLEEEALSYDQIFKRYKEEIDAECKDSFMSKVKGLLKVTDNEAISLGELQGGYEECKSKCLAEKKCRSIGYADYITTMELVGREGNVGKFQIVKKEKVCWIYFRSTSTAKVIIPKGISKTGVYDRLCF